MNRIFTITPGRSGIHWLSAFFWVMARNLPHTAKPEYFPSAIPNPEDVEGIVDEIWEKLPDPYVTTSLLPKNGYLDALGKKGARFIHLRRPIRDTAFSWYTVGGVPGRTPRGLGYHPLPGAGNNEINIADIESDLTDYQLCVWLCLEVEAKARRIAEKYEVHDINLYDISISKNLAFQFLEWTKIPYNTSWWALVESRKIHELPGKYVSDLPRISRAEMVDQRIEIRDILNKRGHEISHSHLP